MKKIVFGGGCFWGVEAYFKKVKGVVNTRVGYAQGDVENPSYERVCRGNTGYAEVCGVTFDENIISFQKILKHYWNIVNPTLMNMQGGDTGTQYRTGIYYYNKEDLTIIKKSMKEEQKKYDRKIVTEVEELKNFYDAEEYHQNYLEKNPMGYCHIDLNKVEKIK